MDICIETEAVPQQFWWDENNPIRGTEKFYVETARSLRRAGHHVDIHKEPNRPTRPRHNYDIVIRCNQRPQFGLPTAMGQRVIEWTNFYFDDEVEYGRHKYGSGDDLVVISQFARDLLPPYLQRKARVVPHGIDRSIYFNDGRERKPQVAFTSAPDRGLDYLKRIWVENDIEFTTGYRLVTGSYGKSSKSDAEVAEMLRESDFWVHPGVGLELFSLAAVEAQSCGATPIVVPSGALRETVLHGYRFPKQDFEAGLFAVLSGQATLSGINAAHIPTWDEATRLLIST